ncbi:TapY2 family type IVa secretion system protein [Shewanella insulae]|uniref:TapY2 family type IVa secretion system protein n=1 Tax=Shewanella insulae TaxID=2681496 RepID=UPI001EFEB74F|nr:TapY2 family type IVa secretion system protein [Shewanella insulae]MCG9711317.1 TapY2 family type IVa secretion system protein [Shewanella insulae]MCG9753741.1 TapY2 family type IVa secretion system protein [Shewanella insulae]
MNKLIAIISCAVAVSVTTSVVAAKQDYKCFINSVKKGDQVVFYRWDIKEAKSRANSLVGKRLSDSNGKKYFIKSVEECVPLSEEFSSGKARKIDSQTLR